MLKNHNSLYLQLKGFYYNYHVYNDVMYVQDFHSLLQHLLGKLDHYQKTQHPTETSRKTSRKMETTITAYTAQTTQKKRFLVRFLG